MEFESSIIELSKRKIQLLKEIEQINRELEFLRKQQEEYDRSTCELECS